MKINKDVEYALMALNRMTDHELHPAAGLAREETIPYKLLCKILQKLNQAGIVESLQGVNGGYRLMRDAAGITLQEIVSAIHEESSLISCVHTEGCAMADACHIQSSMLGLQELWTSLLQNISLERFITMGTKDARIMLSQVMGS